MNVHISYNLFSSNRPRSNKTFLVEWVAFPAPYIAPFPFSNKHFMVF